MEATPRKERTYCRCAARNIVPGSPVVGAAPEERARWGGDSVLEVGLDSAKDDADALRGVKRLAEALVPWLAGVLPPGADGVAQGCSTVSRRAISVYAASR